MNGVDVTNQKENILCIKLPYVMMKDYTGLC